LIDTFSLTKKSIVSLADFNTFIDDSLVAYFFGATL